MHTFLDDVGRHGNMNMSDSDEVAYFSEVREQAAAILTCAPERLAITSSAGEMLSQLPYLFHPPAGSGILAVSSDFPAITRPWIAYAAKNGCDLRFVEEQPTDDLTDTLIERLDERISVMAVSYVQFSTGTRVDIPRLCEATRHAGALLIVDVTQAAGAIPVDTNSWDADVVVCSGYKWLGGHGGVGLAVMSPKFLDQCPPSPGWMGAPDPFDFQATKLPLADDARRYTQSTMSYISLRGLTVAISDLLSLGMNMIETHAVALARLLVENLEGSGWTPFRAIEDKAATGHIVSLSYNGGGIESAIVALRSQKIVCSSRNGRIRISLAHFNDESDVHALIQVLRQVSSR
jgi:cysteine desulfurase / selenocysteine lyase